MRDETTSWGIEPTPPRMRVLSGLDLGLLWGNLGVSLLVLVAGTILVPALSLPEALLAIAIGCVIGNAMIGAAGAIGAQAGVPGMALLRAPLGRRGSLVPTAINVVQCIGWTTFELIVIATAAAALSEELVGVEARWAWTVAFGAAALVLGLLGPVGVARRVLRRVTLWALPVAVGYLTWWGLRGGDLATAWDAPAEGGLSLWVAVDVVVAVTVSWVPLAPDFTRFARSPRAAFWGTSLGYLVPDAWLLGLGATLVLTQGVGDPAGLPAAVVAGGAAAVVALLALTVAETDEAFANAYSGAVSLQNLFPRLPQRPLVVATTLLGTALALTVDLVSYQSYLLLLGSVFVPLFAVLLADWLSAGRRYTEAAVLGGPAWRPAAIGAWLAGVAVYHWLAPTGPSWWVAQVERLGPPEWGLGSTLPSFCVAFGLGLVASLARRTAPARPPVGSG